MLTVLLFFIHSALLLLFGIYLSTSFSGVVFTKKTHFLCLGIFLFSGVLQLAAYLLAGEATVWKIYPLIAHLPLLGLLCIGFHKKWFSAVCSICTAYLCCQPAKWFGVMASSLWNNETVNYLVRICVLLAVAAITLRFVSPCLAEIFNKNMRSVLIFGITPVVYYVFDYISGIYTDFWLEHDRVTLEFLPFFLSIIFLIFCVSYYREYERKADAERREQIIRLTVEEQAKVIKAMERNSLEIRILRHDMRLFLNNLSMCIEHNDLNTAQKLVHSCIDSVNATTVVKFCANTTINYILSSFNAQCQSNDIDFHCQVELDALNCDEIMFSTILSNALDNALNAQMRLPKEERHIRLMLKNHRDKLLLSVKNPFLNPPVFQDGMPVSSQKDHGYGTKSIVYLTQRMGGNCQFIVQNKLFVLQVII